MKAFFKGIPDMIEFQSEEVEIIKKSQYGCYYISHSQGFEKDGIKQLLVLPEHLGFQSMKKESN